jgi:hypothetical protein
LEIYPSQSSPTDSAEEPKNKELAEARANSEKYRKEMNSAKAKGEQYRAEGEDWRRKAVDLANSTQNLIDASKKLVGLQESRDLSAESTVKAARVGSVTVPRSVVMEAAPVIPNWYPLAPSLVAKTIRDNAIAENKDNYSSINYAIERNTEAYEKILRYYKTADPFIKKAINKAALEYGTKFSSFAYDVERQIEARQKFEGK